MDLQDPRGDVLADVLGVSLLRNAMYKRIDAGSPWGMQFGARERSVFYLVARGSARLEVEGEKLLSLSAGDVVLLPHGTAHILRDAESSKPLAVCDGKRSHDVAALRIGGAGPLTTLVTGFFDRGGGRAPALLERLPAIVMLSPTDATAPWVSGTVQLIVGESAAPGPASAIVLQRLADVLFIQTLRSVVTGSACKQAGLPALSDPPIHHALMLIHTQVSAPWNLAKLAAKVGLSRSGFAARFSEAVGEPPLQYLARWRISRAAELLRDSHDDIAQIAGSVGYASVPSFNKAFKKWQGTTPTAFRLLHGSSQAASSTRNLASS